MTTLLMFLTSLIKMKDCLLLELTVFYDCKKSCRKEDYENMTNDINSMSYFWLSQMFLTIERREQCALIKAFYSIRSLKYLAKNCEKWRFNLQTNRVCLVHEPKYIFIVNKQENANCRRYKDFEVDQNITMNRNIYEDK